MLEKPCQGAGPGRVLSKQADRPTPQDKDALLSHGPGFGRNVKAMKGAEDGGTKCFRLKDRKEAGYRIQTSSWAGLQVGKRNAIRSIPGTIGNI